MALPQTNLSKNIASYIDADIKDYSKGTVVEVKWKDNSKYFKINKEKTNKKVGELYGLF